MRVLFAPDYTRGNPYQKLLASALEALGMEVRLLSCYKRLLPLTRGSREYKTTLLHLHWPEAYFQSLSKGKSLLRSLRYPLDLAMATRKTPLVLTAHNLLPHYRQWPRLEAACVSNTLRLARLLVAHSEGAATQLVETFSVAREKIEVIPHGDLSCHFPRLPQKKEARQALHLPDIPIVLFFGRIEPYKGVESLCAAWANHADAERLLCIVGECREQGLRECIARTPRVHASLRHHSDGELAQWIAAADLVVLPFQQILTSGSACLCRSLGVPLALPESASSVALDEPSPRVFRYQNLSEALPPLLERATQLGTSFEAAEPWRQACAWPCIAERTAAAYRSLL